MKRFIVLFLLVLMSCSEDPKYAPMDMYMMAFNFDKTIEEVRVKDTANSINCHMYPEGCIPNSPKRFKIRLVELIVVEYRSSQAACEAALKIKGWYARNWLFDDVNGEPVLEDFIKTVYKASKPDKCD